MTPKLVSEQTCQKERLGNDFGPRFGTPNRSKIDSVFCCLFGHLKKLCSNDFELQNESKMEPILTNFQNPTTIRICCYSLHFRTILHFRSCQISNLIPMPARRDLFLSIRCVFDHFWGSLFDLISSLFSTLIFSRFLTLQIRKSRLSLIVQRAERI